jgi:hypothetical protein
MDESGEVVESGMWQERRSNLRLRETFDAAFVLVEPFFDPQNSWGGHSLEHFAFRVVREHYPELSSEEVHIFVTAAKRIYVARMNRATKDE